MSKVTITIEELEDATVDFQMTCDVALPDKVELLDHAQYAGFWMLKEIRRHFAEIHTKEKLKRMVDLCDVSKKGNLEDVPELREVIPNDES